MSDHLVSLIRTYVPVGVGAALAWLASVLGVGVDDDTSTALTAGAVGLIIAGYYTLVRALESRWPALGILLGKRSEPVYGLPPAESQQETDFYVDGSIKQIRSVMTWPRE